MPLSPSVTPSQDRKDRIKRRIDKVIAEREMRDARTSAPLPGKSLNPKTAKQRIDATIQNHEYGVRARELVKDKGLWELNVGDSPWTAEGGGAITQGIALNVASKLRRIGIPLAGQWGEMSADDLNRWSAAVQGAAAGREEELLGKDSWAAFGLRNARGAAVQLPEMLAAGAAGGLPGVVAHAALSEGHQAVTSGRGRGLESNAITSHVLRKMAIEGGVTGGMSYMGLGGLENMVASTMKRQAKEVVKTAAKETAKKTTGKSAGALVADAMKQANKRMQSVAGKPNRKKLAETIVADLEASLKRIAAKEAPADVARSRLSKAFQGVFHMTNEQAEELTIGVLGSMEDAASGVDPNAMSPEALRAMAGDTIAQTMILVGGLAGGKRGPRQIGKALGHKKRVEARKEAAEKKAQLPEDRDLLTEPIERIIPDEPGTEPGPAPEGEPAPTESPADLWQVEFPDYTVEDDDGWFTPEGAPTRTIEVGGEKLDILAVNPTTREVEYRDPKTGKAAYEVMPKPPIDIDQAVGDISEGLERPPLPTDEEVEAAVEPEPDEQGIIEKPWDIKSTVPRNEGEKEPDYQQRLHAVMTQGVNVTDENDEPTGWSIYESPNGFGINAAGQEGRAFKVVDETDEGQMQEARSRAEAYARENATYVGPGAMGDAKRKLRDKGTYTAKTPDGDFKVSIIVDDDVDDDVENRFAVLVNNDQGEEVYFQEAGGYSLAEARRIAAEELEEPIKRQVAAEKQARDEQEQAEQDQLPPDAPEEDTEITLNAERPLTLTGILGAAQGERKKPYVRVIFRETDVTAEEVEKLVSDIEGYGSVGRLNEGKVEDQGSRITIRARTQEAARAIVERFGGVRVSGEPGTTTIKPKGKKFGKPEPEATDEADAMTEEELIAELNKAAGGKAEPTTGAPVRPIQGEIGMQLEAGQVVLTSSGRETTPFPKVDTSTEGKARNTLKRVDEWLWRNAVDETKSRGDEFNQRQFESEDPRSMPTASKDSMEIYLFGEQPEVPRPFTKPIKTQATRYEAKRDIHPSMQKMFDELPADDPLRASMERVKILVDDKGNRPVPGKPLTVTVYHGKGRKDKGSVYAEGADGPVLGPGRYSAIDRADAATYGPEVSEHRVTLRNPAVIESDAALGDLAGEQIGYDNEGRMSAFRKARAKLEELGFDGVVIILGDGDVGRGGTNKRLREIFGHTQVIEFNPPAAKKIGKAAPKDAAAEAKQEVAEGLDEMAAAIGKLTKKPTKAKRGSGPAKMAEPAADPAEQLAAATAKVIGGLYKQGKYKFRDTVDVMVDAFGADSMPMLRTYLEKAWNRLTQLSSKVDKPDYDAEFARVAPVTEDEAEFANVPEAIPAYVVSGMQTGPKDIADRHLTGRPVGIAVTHIKKGETKTSSDRVISLLARHANNGQIVFLDSGMFGTVKQGKVGQEPDWDVVFEQYDRVIEQVDPKFRQYVMITAPDYLVKIKQDDGTELVIGDPIRTLELQQEHSRRLAEYQDQGVTVIMPVQRDFTGEQSLAALASQTTDVGVEFGTGRVAFGIPYNEAAYSNEEILEFVEKMKGTGLRLHLLGGGKGRAEKLWAQIKEIDPTVGLTGDSTTEVRNRDKHPARGEFGIGSPTRPSDTKVLKEAKLKITRKRSKWSVTSTGTVDGNQATYEYQEIIKSAVPKDERRFNSETSAWEFSEDPTEAIVSGLIDQGLGTGLGSDRDRALALARRESRKVERKRPDQRRTREDNVAAVGSDTKELIAKGKDHGIPQRVYEGQIEDVGAVVNAYENDYPMYVVGSAPGMGKTFVLGGVIRELRAKGVKNFVYVTNSQALIEQVKNDLADYGLEGVEFVTYAGIRKVTPDLAGKCLLCDEAHAMRNMGSATGEAGEQMIGQADFTVFATATPFENVTQAAYLAPSGLFDDVRATFERKIGNATVTQELTGFTAWAWMHGADVRFYKGKPPILVWRKDQTDVEPQQDANEWLLKKGVYTQRPMSLPKASVKSDLSAIKVDQEFVELHDTIVQIYEQAMENAEAENVKSGIWEHGINVRKWILERAKVEHAIARARELVAEGKQVILFTESKSDKLIGRYRYSEGYRKHHNITQANAEFYTPAEIAAKSAEYQEAKRQSQPGDQLGPAPFAPMIQEIAREMSNAGIDMKMESVVDSLKAGLPADITVEYTGGGPGRDTPAKSRKNLAAWKAGEKKIIIATMAKGGTGLSFHDTTGDMPERVQIVISLPWSATQLTQVAGRLARLGTAKPVALEWLFSENIEFERNLTHRVGARLRSMTAAVQGTESAMGEAIQDFNFEVRGTPPPTAIPEPVDETVDTQTATRDDLEEDATDFIKEVISSKKPPKTSDEAWELYRKNIGADTRQAPIVGREFFNDAWRLFSKEEPLSDELQRLGDRAIPRKQLQEEGYATTSKSSDFHDIGYQIVQWFNPKTKDEVVEFTPWSKSDQPGRVRMTASTHAEQVEVHEALGKPVVGPDEEVSPKKEKKKFGKQSPLEEKFRAAKKETDGAMLLFKMGDFYELFYEDAEAGAKALGLTLTTRDKDSDNPVPMAGFPHHQLDGYITKLVAGGNRVAVVEQLNSPDPPTVGPVQEPAAAEWFHGSHDNVTEFTNRDVDSIDSIGTWVTGSQETAGTRYGPNVQRVEHTPRNMLEAHTSDFDEFFFSNENLFREQFPDEPLSTFKRFRENGLRQRDNGIWQMRRTYLRAFRDSLEKAGYDGVIWKDSTIDSKKGEEHDVAVFFHTSPIAVGKPSLGAPVRPTPEPEPQPKKKFGRDKRGQGLIDETMETEANRRVDIERIVEPMVKEVAMVEGKEVADSWRPALAVFAAELLDNPPIIKRIFKAGEKDAEGDPVHYDVFEEQEDMIERYMDAVLDSDAWEKASPEGVDVENVLYNDMYDRIDKLAKYEHRAAGEVRTDDPKWLRQQMKAIKIPKMAELQKAKRLKDLHAIAEAAGIPVKMLRPTIDQMWRELNQMREDIPRLLRLLREGPILADDITLEEHNAMDVLRERGYVKYQSSELERDNVAESQWASPQAELERMLKEEFPGISPGQLEKGQELVAEHQRENELPPGMWGMDYVNPAYFQMKGRSLTFTLAKDDYPERAAPPAEPEPVEPFTAQSLQDHFDLTKDQAAGVAAVATAMGLDVSAIGVTTLPGMPEGGLAQIGPAAEAMGATGDTFQSEEEFFPLWNKMLRALGGKQRGKRQIKEAVDDAIDDIAEWIEDNPQFANYYAADNAIERSLLVKRYPELAEDENWAFYKVITAIASNRTRLEKNTQEQIDAWESLREGGKIDVEVGRNAQNNPFRKRSAFTIHGAAQGVKTLHYATLNTIVEQQGSLGAAVEWIFAKIPATTAAMNEARRSVGMSDSTSIASSKKVSATATGDDTQISRSFALFGPKVGAYVQNHLGQSEYTTGDVWESRFWRSFFKGVGTATGLETDPDLKELYAKASNLFADKLDMTPSEAQAVRWYYTIEKMKEAGYNYARTKDKISTYAGREVTERDARDGGKAKKRRKVANLRRSRKGRKGSDLRSTLGSTIFGPGALAQREGETVKAVAQFVEDGKVIIAAVQDPDVSSALHELAHVARRQLLVDPNKQDLPEGITLEMINTVTNWANVTYGRWTVEAEEKFARAFEKYMREGKSPNKQLDSVFAKFAKWLKKIYKSLKGSAIDVNISPEMTHVFELLVTRSIRLDAAAKTGLSPDAPAMHTFGPGRGLPRKSDPNLGEKFGDWSVSQVWRTASAKQADGQLHLTVSDSQGNIKMLQGAEIPKFKKEAKKPAKPEPTPEPKTPTSREQLVRRGFATEGNKSVRIVPDAQFEQNKRYQVETTIDGIQSQTEHEGGYTLDEARDVAHDWLIDEDATEVPQEPVAEEPPKDETAAAKATRIQKEISKAKAEERLPHITQSSATELEIDVEQLDDTASRKSFWPKPTAGSAGKTGKPSAWLKKFIAVNPEFEFNPVFIVENRHFLSWVGTEAKGNRRQVEDFQPMLVWKMPGVSYRFDPAIFGITEPMADGTTVRFVFPSKQKMKYKGRLPYKGHTSTIYATDEIRNDGDLWTDGQTIVKGTNPWEWSTDDRGPRSTEEMNEQRIKQAKEAETPRPANIPPIQYHLDDYNKAAEKVDPPENVEQYETEEGPLRLVKVGSVHVAEKPFLWARENLNIDEWAASDQVIVGRRDGEPVFVQAQHKSPDEEPGSVFPLKPLKKVRKKRKAAKGKGPAKMMEPEAEPAAPAKKFGRTSAPELVAEPAPETEGPDLKGMTGETPKAPVTDKSDKAGIAAADMIKTLGRIFKIPATRIGTVRGRELGHYVNLIASKNVERTLRLTERAATNIAVYIHEIGHHLDRVYGLISAKPGQKTPVVPSELRVELESLDYEPKGRQYEGWAEFLRIYLTEPQGKDAEGNWVSGTMARAPEFTKWFEETYLPKNPELKKQLDEARQYVKSFSEQSLMRKMKAMIGNSPGDDLDFKERELARGKKKVHEWKVNWYDQFQIATDIDDAYFAAGGKGPGIRATIDVHQFAASSEAARALEDGVHDLATGQRFGESFWKRVDALLETDAEKDDSEVFMWARHTMWAAAHRRGYNTGMAPNEARRILDAIAEKDPDQYKRFDKIAVILSDTAHELLEMQVRAGTVPPATVDKIIEDYGDNYFPLFRAMENERTIQGNGSSYVNLPKGVKGRSKSGSGRPILSPYDSMQKMAVEYYGLAARGRINERLHSAIDPNRGGVEGLGWVGTRIGPKKKLTVTTVEQMLDQLVKSGWITKEEASDGIVLSQLRNMRGDENEIAGVPSDKAVEGFFARNDLEFDPEEGYDLDAISEILDRGPSAAETLAIWKPAYDSEPGKMIAVSYDRSGNPLLYEYDKDVYEMLTSLAPPAYNGALGMLRNFNQVFKGAAVGVSAAFGVINLVADYFTYLGRARHLKGFKVFSEPWKQLYRQAQFKRRLLQKRGLEKLPSDLLLFEQMGGTSYSRVGTDVASRERSTTRRLSKTLLGKAGFASGSIPDVAHGIKTSAMSAIEVVENFVSISDAPPRLAEMIASIREDGYEPLTAGKWTRLKDGATVDGLPEDIRIRGMSAAANATINFKKGGVKMRHADIFLPFAMATMNANYRFGQEVINVKNIGQDTEDGRRARRYVAYLVSTAATAAAYYLLRRDDEDYKNAEDWEVDKYWTIGAGGRTYFRIPKARDEAFIANAVESLLGAALGDEDTRGVAETLLQDMTNRIPTGGGFVKGAVEVAVNRDLYRGRDIEPAYMQQRSKRNIYTDRTRELSKHVGQFSALLNLSPAQVEHLINAVTAGTYERMHRYFESASTGDFVTPAVGATGLRSVYTNRHSSRAVTDFYERLGELTTEIQDANVEERDATEAKQEHSNLDAYRSLLSSVFEAQRTTPGDPYKYTPYAVGLTREALGYESLDNSPNPLYADPESVPEVLQEAMKKFTKRATKTPLTLQRLPQVTPKNSEPGSTLADLRQTYRAKLDGQLDYLESHLDSPVIAAEMRNLFRTKTWQQAMKRRPVQGTRDRELAKTREKSWYWMSNEEYREDLKKHAEQKARILDLRRRVMAKVKTFGKR